MHPLGHYFYILIPPICCVLFYYSKFQVEQHVFLPQGEVERGLLRTERLYVSSVEAPTPTPSPSTCVPLTPAVERLRAARDTTAEETSVSAGRATAVTGESVSVDKGPFVSVGRGVGQKSVEIPAVQARNLKTKILYE